MLQFLLSKCATIFTVLHTVKPRNKGGSFYLVSVSFFYEGGLGGLAKEYRSLNHHHIGALSSSSPSAGGLVSLGGKAGEHAARGMMVMSVPQCQENRAQSIP